MIECIECGKRQAVYCADCVEDIKAGYGDYKAGQLDEGRERIGRTLDNIYMKDGSAAAEEVARDTLKEYIAAPGKSLFDYGVFCGTAEWLELKSQAYKP